jgi:hypothetical protein
MLHAAGYQSIFRFSLRTMQLAAHNGIHTTQSIPSGPVSMTAIPRTLSGTLIHTAVQSKAVLHATSNMATAVAMPVAAPGLTAKVANMLRAAVKLVQSVDRSKLSFLFADRHASTGAEIRATQRGPPAGRPERDYCDWWTQGVSIYEELDPVSRLLFRL